WSGLAAAVGLTIDAEGLASLLSIARKGLSVVIATVYSSTASTRLIMSNKARRENPFAGSNSRWKFALMAAALTGVPSWNLCPRRSLKVQVRPSLDALH